MVEMWSVSVPHIKNMYGLIPEEQGELAGLLQVLQYSHMVLNHAVFGSIVNTIFYKVIPVWYIFQVDCKATALWVG